MTTEPGSGVSSPVLPQPPGWTGWQASTGWVMPLPWAARQRDGFERRSSARGQPSTSVRAAGSTMFLLLVLIALWLLFRR